MKTAQDRQKSYVDRRRRPLEFNMGDRVYLKVPPWKHWYEREISAKIHRAL
jgi:hypothetical protein